VGPEGYLAKFVLAGARPLLVRILKHNGEKGLWKGGITVTPRVGF